MQWKIIRMGLRMLVVVQMRWLLTSKVSLNDMIDILVVMDFQYNLLAGLFQNISIKMYVFF